MADIHFLSLKEFYKLSMIALGAVPGAFIRWHVSNDFIVNIVGAMVLGFVVGLPFRRRRYLILSVGFCGALTTFSGWMFESAVLFLSGSFIKAFGLIVYTLGLGLIAAAIGFFIGRHIMSRTKLFL